MRSVVSTFTRTVATLAVAAIPVAAFAQTQAAAQPNPAAEHLAAARSALNKVLNAPAPSGDAFKKLSDLKTEYMALEKSASTASPDWAAHYATIDRLVGELIGAPAAASGEAGAVGTSGRAGAMKGVDAGVAANLDVFRTELKAFSTAMSAVAPAATATPSTASAPASPTTAAASATPSTASSGSVVAGTAPKAAPVPAPGAPVSASGSPATSAPAASSAAPMTTAIAANAGTTPAADTSLAAQIDPAIALLDAALTANPVDASGKVSVDRATLDAIKAQLQVIKAK
jgi:hypothetical protein